MSEDRYYRTKSGTTAVIMTDVLVDGCLKIDKDAFDAFARDCGARRLPGIVGKHFEDGLSIDFASGNPRRADGRVPRVYIAGPVTGTSDYRERFAAAEAEYVSYGYDVVNPVRVLARLPWMDHDECMAVCRTLLPMCDIAHFLKGFENSAGAAEEYRLAEALCLTIFREDNGRTGLCGKSDKIDS